MIRQFTACGKGEFIRLTEGQKWEKGDYLIGSNISMFTGLSMVDLVNRGYEPADQPGTLRGHTNYWLIRPRKYVENEFGMEIP